MKHLIFLPAFCLFASCDQDSKIVSEPDPEPAACCSEEPAPEAVEASEGSIYQLDSQWRDAAGKERSLGSLSGQVQVVSMGYTTCQYACPRLLADMRQIEANLPEEVRKLTHFSFISIDPERDSPERLSAYRKENKIDLERWTLLTGDVGSVQELAVVLGIQFRKTGDGDFAHSNVLTVLNSKGEIIHRQNGLGGDSRATIAAISGAAR
jgi:protein SCO1/2